MASACCPPGSHPGLASSECPELKGEVVSFGHVKAYKTAIGSGPWKAAVVVVHDVWGINSGRTRAAADLLASTGDYVVVVPDLYYDEDTIDNHGGLDPFPVEWVKKFTPERLTTDVEIVRTALTTELIDGGKAGIIGFCWGAFVVFECCQKKDSFSAGVSMHPSIQIAGIFGHSPVQLAEGVTCPQLLLPAGNDQEADKPGGDVIVALQKLPGIGDACKSHVFPEMVHGWVPRGDVSEPAIARDVDLAMKMTKDFLDTHLL